MSGQKLVHEVLELLKHCVLTALRISENIGVLKGVNYYLSKKKLLVFVNVGAYLTKDEVEKVVEYIRLSHQTVLFIEPRRLYDFPQYVLDEDYFLSSENML